MTSFSEFRALYKSYFQACIEDIDWKRVCFLMEEGDDTEGALFIEEHLRKCRDQLDIWLMDRAVLPPQLVMRDFLAQVEAKSGPLSDRKKAELLYDNFSQVESVEHGLELLKLIERKAA